METLEQIKADAVEVFHFDRECRPQDRAHACNRCMKVSTMLFGHYDALCGLDSCGTDTWQRLADLIDRPSENIERPR